MRSAWSLSEAWEREGERSFGEGKGGLSTGVEEWEEGLVGNG